MRHRNKTFKIGKSHAHRKAMLANMLVSLFTHGRIKTTVTKSNELRRWADTMVTCAKKGDLSNKKKVISTLRPRYSKYDAITDTRVVNEIESVVVKNLFEELSPKYKDRNGGYTRLIKLNNRIGDGAQLCIVELVEEEIRVKGAAVVETTEAPAEEAPVVEAVATEAAEEAKAED